VADELEPHRSSTSLGFVAAFGLVVVGAIGLLVTTMSRPPHKTPTPARTGPPLPRRADGLPAFGESVRVKELPRAIVKVAPEYPERERENGIEGMVIVQALVGRDGLVKDTRVTRSIPGFDESAVAAVGRWTFSPALGETGKPVGVWVAVPVKFTLAK
jgi:TonB family protein